MENPKRQLQQALSLLKKSGRKPKRFTGSDYEYMIKYLRSAGEHLLRTYHYHELDEIREYARQLIADAQELATEMKNGHGPGYLAGFISFVEECTRLQVLQWQIEHFRAAPNKMKRGKVSKAKKKRAIILKLRAQGATTYPKFVELWKALPKEELNGLTKNKDMPSRTIWYESY